MSYKLLILIILAVICFINNLFVNFDVLQVIVEDTEVTTAIVDKGIEEKPSNYIKMLYRYFVYYLYFYDAYNQLTIFELITLGG